MIQVHDLNKIRRPPSTLHKYNFSDVEIIDVDDDLFSYMTPFAQKSWGTMENGGNAGVSSTSRAYQMPSSTSRTYQMPSSTSRTYQMPSSTSRSYQMPSSTSRTYQMPSFADCLPPVADYIHSIKADSISTQCSEIIDHFSMEVAQVIAPKTVVKVIEDLSHQICKYHSLALTIGTNVDNESLRQELLEIQQKACDTVISTTTQLSDAFRRADSIPKKEIADLERSCKVLVACIHTLDRELRRTMHLYCSFPLVPHIEGKETFFIRTGVSEKIESKDKSALVLYHCSPSEKYLRERESWQELQHEILRVHDLDVELHRDEVLGPVLDYLTLCPMGEIPGSKVSLDDTSDLPEGYCDEETLLRKKSNLICYLSAILAVACIGGGVLMGVIFMMEKEKSDQSSAAT